MLELLHLNSLMLSYEGMRAEILKTPSSGSTAQNTIGNRMLEVKDVRKTGGKWSLNVR